MKRFLGYSVLKPEKVEDYKKLHAAPWEDLLELLHKANITHYSISLRGNEVFTYYEYVGDDYESDMNMLDNSEVMQRWWVYSKPCFMYHEKGEYYEDLEEVFYMP